MMFTSTSRISIVLAGYAVLIAGNGLLGTLVSLRLAPPAFSTAAAGVVQSAYYLGFMLGALTAGRLIKRFGALRAFSAFALIVACASLGHAAYAGQLAWFCLRFITGACLAGIFSVVESQLNAAASNAVRGRVLAFYMMTTYLGVSSGQLLLNAASPAGSLLFVFSAVLFSASLLPLVLGKALAGPEVNQGLPSLIGLRAIATAARLAPLGMAGCVLAGLFNSGFYSLMPLFLKQVGFSVSLISGIMFSALMTALLFQWPIGALADRFNRQRVLLAVCGAIGFISLVAVCGQQPAVTAILVCLYAGLVFTVYALSAALVNDCVPPELRLAASAAILLMFSLGGCAGPVLASLALVLLGPYGIFWFSLTVACCFSILVLMVFGLHGSPVKTSRCQNPVP